MVKSALLKSSLAKKYWMAITGLFLCTFLLGHLVGNLQLIFGDALQFNQYALFMTTNPAVKILSYITYASILFHVVDGIILTIKNIKARPIGYVKQNAAASSSFASRNMAVLGSIVLVFIIIHLKNFWYEMHYCSEMPLQTITINTVMNGKQEVYIMTSSGVYLEKEKVASSFELATSEPKEVFIKDKTKFYSTQNPELQIGEGYKDLHKITFDFFRIEKNKLGLVFTILYVLAMGAVGFHLWHGFQSAFVSLGIRNKSWTPRIQLAGKLFAVIVPLLFAIIPICIHFKILVK
jgi:succinate dehydrogenase / fumarate reductase, cytochrome b subunit